MAKGTFSEGKTYYYSESLPQGQGSDIEYNKEMYEKLSHVMNYFHNIILFCPVFILLTHL